jgi:hypothetical protein
MLALMLMMGIGFFYGNYRDIGYFVADNNVTFKHCDSQ